MGYYEIKPTKAEFLRYEGVRRGGKYNMIMEAQSVLVAARIGLPQLRYIFNHYSALAKEYLPSDTMSSGGSVND